MLRGLPDLPIVARPYLQKSQNAEGKFFELRRTQICRDDNSVRGAAIPYVHPEALAMPD